jgi:GNAT superfamily N-acetyltransferase
MTHDPAQPEAPFAHRPLDAADIPQVLALYRASILPTWLASGRDHDFERIEANIRARMGDADYGLEVAEAPTGALVGYLAWERHPDHTSRHVVAHLRMILVHPDQQGSGLGAALMARFEAAARAAGCSKVLFDVVTGSPARRFYERLGYQHWSDYLEKVLDEP